MPLPVELMIAALLSDAALIHAGSDPKYSSAAKPAPPRAVSIVVADEFDQVAGIRVWLVDRPRACALPLSSVQPRRSVVAAQTAQSRIRAACTGYWCACARW